MKRVLVNCAIEKVDCPVLCKRVRFNEANSSTSDYCDISTRVKYCRYEASNSHVCANESHRCCPPSLLLLSARVAAANVPFQLVEERYVPIPEPVVRQFITWSFPRSESDIRRYSALSCSSCDTSICKNISSHDRVPQSPSHGRTDSFRFSAVKDSQSDGSLNDADSHDTFRLGGYLAETGAVHYPIQIGKGLFSPGFKTLHMVCW